MRQTTQHHSEKALDWEPRSRRPPHPCPDAGPAPASAPTANNMQPALLAMAAEQPDTQVRVIIQKSDVAADVAGLVTELGGTVIKDLHIINAVVAEMAVETAVDLSYDASVNWVSLDGAGRKRGKPPKDPSPNTLPENYYLDTLNVRQVWDMGLRWQRHWRCCH